MGKWSGFNGVATGNRKEEPDEPEEEKWFTPLFRLPGQRKTVIEEIDTPKAVEQEDGQ